MKKKKLLILSMALLLGYASSEAVPAYPVKRVITLDNNTQLTVTLRGDEHFHFYEASDGRLFREQLDGCFQELSAKDVEDQWTERVKAQNIRRSQRATARAFKTGQPQEPLIGTRRGLVILAGFSDLSFTTENANAVFKNFFNQKGYKDFGMNGSVRDYFLAQSYGQFDLQFDVVGPVKLPGTMGFYGAPTDNSNDVHPAVMARDACKAAADSVDFSIYDWDGDGEVDQVFIIYAGYGQAQGGAPNTIWPHEYVLSGEGLTLSLDGVSINTYACSCELRGNSGSELDGIGTACHEFTHCLGLPDMYDTAGNNYGMGNWDVMDSGNYNNDGKTPAGYTAYERWFAGWLTPTELSDMTRVQNMQPLEKTPEAYILYNEGNRNEYYLLENRQQIDWDAFLGGHGLLVVHVDYDKDCWVQNAVNRIADHQRMTIMPADGRTTLRSEAGDPFPGSSKVTELTNYSAIVATTYNTNKDGSKLMSKPLDNISEDTDNHTVSFVACRPELGIPQPEDGVKVGNEAAFTISWPAIEGAVAYEVNVTESGTASNDPKEALEHEFDFSDMISKTVGFSDVGMKLKDYGLTGWTGSKIFTTPNKMRIGTSTSAGSIKTPTWNVPHSSDMTIVMGANVVKEGSPVKGVLRAAYGNIGDNASYESRDFNVAGEEMLVFNFNIRKDLFWIEINPVAQMYLTYLAVYDGNWTAEQLGIGGGSSARGMLSPNRATTQTNYTTETNSITLENLNLRSRYMFKVRALGEENTYSQWSDEKSFAFDETGINSIQLSCEPSGSTYDLTGRQVKQPRKGIYVRNGRKMVY